MPSNVSKKGSLRSQFLEKRLTCSPLEIKKKSSIIQKNFLRVLKNFSSIRCIALYAEIQNEVQTKVLFKELRRKNIQIVYPKVNQKKKKLEFFPITNIALLKSQAYAILEPPAGAQKVDNQAIDMIVVPAVVFDEKGYRLGYGKGYYDKVLSNSRAKAIGLAFEFQVMRQIPKDSWDKPVGVLITEKKMRIFH